MKLWKFTSLAIVFALSTVTNAATVTETWNATIFESVNTSYSIGDSITWGITYDDQDNYFYSFDNGANGLDDNGSGDDGAFKYCHVENTDLDCNNKSSTLPLMANAVFDFSSIYETFLASTSITSFLDTSSFSNDIRFTETNGIENFSSISDYYEFTFQNLPGNGSFVLRGRDENQTLAPSYIQFTDVSFVSTVPIPSAVWLFGSGLISLVGFARRKKA